MSGAEPLRDDRRAAEPNSLEPSMDEILASIRRILADGHGVWNASQGSCGGRDQIEPGASSDRSEIAPDTSRSSGLSELSDIVGSGTPALARPRATTTGGRNAAIASTATEASVARAFQALVASRFVRNTDLVADLTREMIRPLLEAWIDEHLPGIVERLVAAEIARMTRGE